ncbi:hypothetical protein ACVITL_003379 [Rhizobium pisi]
MRRRDLYNKANYLLSLLHLQIQGSSGLNLLDTNVHAENLYRDFLNLAYSYGLINVNLLRSNFPAIDLADDGRKLCVQVTSQEGSAKVRQTLKSYRENALHQRFDRLVILVLGASGSKSGKAVTFDNGKKFDPSQDVWDKDTLLAHLNGMEIDLLGRCVKFLEDNIRFPERDSVPREVRTIVKLLEFLCSEDVVAPEGFREDPDPTGKVYRRFAEHSKFLLGRYTDLYPEYGRLLGDVIQAQGLTPMEIRRMHAYLKGKSDRRLTECDGDPVKAIDMLVGDLSALLARADIDYDEGAVEFFLLAQLIECNVFPNRADVDA